MMEHKLDLAHIDSSWTLFLDRDGVINYEKEGDYIYHPDEFRFYEGAVEALQICSRIFKRLIIVTNQKGVEKGLMTLADLHAVHTHMRNELQKAAVTLDEIFFCTALNNDHPNRKPQPGMALLAKAQFPDIDFATSIMIGNNLSDMYFGRNAGMYTVFLLTTAPNQPLPHPAIDLAFKDLLNFAGALQEA